MMQEQKLAPKTKYLLEASNQFYQELLGYKPEQTSLQKVPKSQWNNFCKSIGQPINKLGIYSSRNQTAIIQKENSLSLFHEYFGHGLYCEQSLAGRKLINLEQKLFEEEKQEFKEKQFTLKDLEKSRKTSLTFQELNNFKEQNLTQYELFAVWTEYLLSKKFKINEIFEKKYDNLSKKDKEQVERIINFSEQYGNLATFYESGLARITTPERVKKLIGEIYGINNVEKSKLILLAGSKKPFSDIDLFSSSNVLFSSQNNWLDLVNFDEQDFEKRIKNFEVQVTHPIMEGEFITGDKIYLLQKRKQLKEQPITKEAIEHNFRKSEQEKIASEKTNDKELKRIYTYYSETYLANALALKDGLRLFVKEDLLSYSYRETNIQLKGGKKNNAT